MCDRFEYLTLIRLTTMKVYACYTVKFYKNKTQNIFKRRGGGRTPGAPVLDPHLRTGTCTCIDISKTLHHKKKRKCMQE